jgi:hypothetical protein
VEKIQIMSTSHETLSWRKKPLFITMKVLAQSQSLKLNPAENTYIRVFPHGLALSISQIPQRACNLALFKDNHCKAMMGVAELMTAFSKRKNASFADKHTTRMSSPSPDIPPYSGND